MHQQAKGRGKYLFMNSNENIFNGNSKFCHFHWEEGAKMKKVQK